MILLFTIGVSAAIGQVYYKINQSKWKPDNAGQFQNTLPPFSNYKLKGGMLNNEAVVQEHDQDLRLLNEPVRINPSMEVGGVITKQNVDKPEAGNKPRK